MLWMCEVSLDFLNSYARLAIRQILSTSALDGNYFFPTYSTPGTDITVSWPIPATVVC